MDKQTVSTCRSHKKGCICLRLMIKKIRVIESNSQGTVVTCLSELHSLIRLPFQFLVKLLQAGTRFARLIMLQTYAAVLHRRIVCSSSQPSMSCSTGRKPAASDSKASTISAIFTDWRNSAESTGRTTVLFVHSVSQSGCATV